jgi:hypothetical protein
MIACYVMNTDTLNNRPSACVRYADNCTSVFSTKVPVVTCVTLDFASKSRYVANTLKQPALATKVENEPPLARQHVQAIATRQKFMCRDTPSPNSSEEFAPNNQRNYLIYVVNLISKYPTSPVACTPQIHRGGVFYADLNPNPKERAEFGKLRQRVSKLPIA